MVVGENFNTFAPEKLETKIETMKESTRIRLEIVKSVPADKVAAAYDFVTTGNADALSSLNEAREFQSAVSQGHTKTLMWLVQKGYVSPDDSATIEQLSEAYCKRGEPVYHLPGGGSVGGRKR